MDWNMLGSSFADAAGEDAHLPPSTKLSFFYSEKKEGRPQRFAREVKRDCCFCFPSSSSRDCRLQIALQRLLGCDYLLTD
jgi:hypothetical protein